MLGWVDFKDPRVVLDPEEKGRVGHQNMNKYAQAQTA